MPACANVAFDRAHLRFGDQVEGGRDDQFVPVEIGVGFDDVDGHADVTQGGVGPMHLVEVGDIGGGFGVGVERPPCVPAEEDGHVGDDGGSTDLSQPTEQRTQFGHFAPGIAVGAGVRQHGGVELLAPAQRGSPLEEADSVGTARELGERVPGHLSRRFCDIAGLPVDGTGRRFHQQPRASTRDSPGEVGRERELCDRIVQPVVEVVIVGDDVDVRRPLKVVHVADVGGHHEVRGDGHARHRAHHLRFGEVLAEGFVGAEPLEVERLGWVAGRHGEPRSVDLGE